MRLEQISDNAIHIIDELVFLGEFLSPMRTNSKEWKYKPSGNFLSNTQMDEIKKHLKKLNSSGT